jgi:hypothetical protein
MTTTTSPGVFCSKTSAHIDGVCLLFITTQKMNLLSPKKWAPSKQKHEAHNNAKSNFLLHSISFTLARVFSKHFSVRRTIYQACRKATMCETQLLCSRSLIRFPFLKSALITERLAQHNGAFRIFPSSKVIFSLTHTAACILFILTPVCGA